MAEDIKEVEEVQTAEDAQNESMTSDLREDTLKTSPFLKHPVQHIPDSDRPLTAADIKKMSQDLEAKFRAELQKSRIDPNLLGQIVPKENVAIKDFADLTMDDVYNLDIPIMAKPFFSADILDIKLKDTNYVPRWVNKNPQRLGDYISKGFTYIEPNDLLPGTDDVIKASLDAQGHYSIHDVVAMKIDKATYMQALRAAFLRAKATTNQVHAREKAAQTAASFMAKESGFGNDFKSAAAQGKMKFYDPEIGV